MASRTSPTVRKRRLRSEMQRLRKESGKTAEEAARYAGIAVATVYRIESGAHSPKPADIIALCRLYGVDEARTEVLATLARQSRQRGWWQEPGGAIPPWFEFYVGLEEEASDIKVYQPELIYGLFQTEAYVRALMQADPSFPQGGPEELEKRVATRKRRQERLYEPDAPKLWVVLSEGALRREVGGPRVMREQLEHLLTISHLKNVTLQAMPYSSGAHAAIDGAFHIIGFPEMADSAVVYVEYRRGSLYLEKPADIVDYTEVFDHLRASALGPAETRTLIKESSEGIA